MDIYENENLNCNEPAHNTATARSCSPHICCLSLSEWPAIDKKLCAKWISLAPFTQTLAHHRQCGCVHVHKIHIVQLPAACVLVQKQDFLLWKQKDSMATIPKYTTHMYLYLFNIKFEWNGLILIGPMHAMPCLYFGFVVFNPQLCLIYVKRKTKNGRSSVRRTYYK